MYREIIINANGEIEMDREIFNEEYKYFLSIFDNRNMNNFVNDGWIYYNSDEIYKFAAKYD